MTQEEKLTEIIKKAELNGYQYNWGIITDDFMEKKRELEKRIFER